RAAKVKTTYAADSEADSWDGQLYRQIYRRFHVWGAGDQGRPPGLPCGHERPSDRALRQVTERSPRAGGTAVARPPGTADFRERVSAGVEAVGGPSEDDPER